MVRHQVQRVDLGLGEFCPARDLLGARRSLGIRNPIGPQIRARVHQAVHRDAAPFGDLIVVMVMRAGDLHRARAKIGVRVTIGDDRDQAAVFLGPHGDFTQLAHDGRIAFVARVHGDRAIAQHRLGPRRGDGDVIPRLAQGDVSVCVPLDIFIRRATGERVLEVPHMARRFDILDLQIGNRRLEMRVPIDQPLAAVNQALVVHLHKDADHGVVEIALVPLWRARGARHRKRVARPIAGGAKALHLLDDRVAFFRLPIPDMAQEFLAAHLLAAAVAAFGQALFHLQLRGDAGMVLARLPQRVKSAHPVPAHQNVHQRVVEGMAHMQRARHVGWRQHDREAFIASFARAGPKRAFGLPQRGNPRLVRFCVECLVHRPILVRRSPSDVAKRARKAKRDWTPDARRLVSAAIPHRQERSHVQIRHQPARQPC